MAAIRANDGVLAISSGNSVLVTNIRRPNVIQTLTFPSLSSDKQEKKDDEDSVQSGLAGDGSSVPNRALASGFSACGRYLAVCDDLKVLYVYGDVAKTEEAAAAAGSGEGEDSWKLLSSRELVRRATNLTFTLDEATVIVADKSGDIYAFPTATEDKDGDAKVQGQLLLGHLSMVLDVCLADQDRYVVTCDRDEKIRISHYPNAYNIHTYCLGHTQFVSCLTYVEEFGVVISGSGDCSLRVWNMEGKQLCQAVCPVNRSADTAVAARQTAAVVFPQRRQQQQQRHGDDDGEENGDEKEASSGEDQVGKTAIQGMAYCKQCRLLVVSFYSQAELQVYKLSVTGNQTSLDLLQTIPLTADPWDVTFDDKNNTLWVLSPVEGTTLSAYRVSNSGSGEDAENMQLVKLEDDGSKVHEVLKTVNSKWDFFSDSLRVPSNIPSLWKNCSQDQLEEYKQRKQQRLQDQGGKVDKRHGHGKSPTGGKKPSARPTADPASQQSPEALPEKKPRVS